VLAAKPTAVTAALSQPAAEDVELVAGKKVLVVEDDARNLYAITSLLERHGVNVFPATSAREALAALGQHPDTDLVIMDVMMPDVDGYQATKQIHAMKEFAALPVIALTAKASEADEAEAIAVGCSAYMVKPADTRQLLSVIARHLRAKQ
jgi:CheY-like chemotaxis protein